MAVTTYLVLLRGINVGGKNKIAMPKLKAELEAMGFDAVSTYIQSGNAILRSGLDATTLARRIESRLTDAFALDSALIKVLALSRATVQAMVDARPRGFGDEPGKYHSDAIFLMDLEAAEAMSAFSPREGVDTVWPGDGIIYSQRLTALRTRSHLNRAMASPLYKSMTIRSWGTTTKLLELLTAADTG